ncbi:MAG: tetratricopeptide repeat protein [Gemmatimonadaceae bacterium]|nr:tetratricopeptide repeat protein [Chitinophagaceae bacterium]
MLREITICFFLLLVLGFHAPAQDINTLRKEAERLENTHQEEALKKYQEILRLQPSNLNAIIKMSELCSGIGHRQSTKPKKIDFFNAARKYAELALRLNAQSSDANFAMSIAVGRMALIIGGKQKIEAVNEIKKYAELSIRYDATNFKAWHVLGKWHYEVSSLNALERTAAKVFYGGIPAGSIQQAIANYEKARSLKPDFIVNHLELAKAYYKNDQEKKAIELLKSISKIPSLMQDDDRVKNEARELLKDWE